MIQNLRFKRQRLFWNRAILLLATLSGFAHAEIDTTATFTGEATCYSPGTEFVVGNCAFDPREVPTMFAAINGPQYNNAEWCGAWVQITGPGGTAIIKIIDQCPECQAGDLDFNEAAFVQITGSTNGCDGRYPITWKWIPAPINHREPLRFYSEGSNPFYLKLQCGNPVNPIKTMEILINGNYQLMNRTNDNHYIYNAAYPSDSFTIRVTDIFDNEVETSGLQLAQVAMENVGQSGLENFPAPSGPLTDSDNDGLPDMWEQQYVADNSLTPQSDNDKDGIPAIFEFTYGLNPIIADPASVLPTLIDRTNPDWLTFRYRLSDLASQSLTIEVATSTTLNVWTTNNVEQKFSETSLGNATKQITARIPITAGQPARFLRLRASRTASEI